MLTLKKKVFSYTLGSPSGTTVLNQATGSVNYPGMLAFNIHLPSNYNLTLYLVVIR